jgi:protein-tyrosine phosphatase
LLKRRDGTRFLAAWPLLWPYFLLTAFAFWLFRLTSREPAFTLVAHNLYLGRRLTPREVRQAHAVGWQAVLDLAAEFAEVRRLQRLPNYRSLPVLDATAPTWEHLHVAVEWLRQQVARGPVLVHCALGHGRSVTVVVAYLLTAGRAPTLQEGLTWLRSQRRGVGLHSCQRNLLRRYEQTLLGNQGQRLLHGHIDSRQ